MKSLAAQVSEFRRSKKWSQGAMAAAVRAQPGGETVQYQHIGQIERGEVENPRYIGALAAAMGVPTDDLLQGKYVLPTAGEGSRTVDVHDPRANTEDCQKIPTSAMFTPINLSATILLLGSMLARMDPRSRRVMGLLLSDLASDPDEAQDVADKASSLASKQKAVTSSKSLDAAIQGKDGAFVETRPAKLEQ